MRQLTSTILLYILACLFVNVLGFKTKNEYESTSVTYKILVLTPMGSRSHKNFFMGAVNALASRGHEVTVVSTFKESKLLPNIRDIIISGPDIANTLGNPFESGPTKVMTDLFFKFPQKCTESLGKKEVQELKMEKFDFVLISTAVTDCFMSLVHHFEAPYAYGITMPLNSGLHQMTGSIYLESLAPNILLGARFPATFLQRLQSSVLTNILNIAYVMFTAPRMDHYCKEANLCPLDMPGLWDRAGNNSLVIMNSVRELETPAQPWLPHVIHVGGIHCRPAQKLTKDLEDWIEDSGKEGFIFFSLGSSVFPSNMPERHWKSIVNTFASLKMKVLWKWDQESMDNLPPNVKISKWLPQQDILGHAKIRLFITHGGLLSTQEAIYHNCPILGLPLFADQFNNIGQAVMEGWGEKITWSELTQDLLRSKILSIIGNKELKETVELRSNIMKDRLNTPAELVVHWIEYVIRYGGAEHMKSPLPKLYWFQLFNVDVWLTLLGISAILLVLWIKLIKYFIVKIFIRKTKTD